MYNETMKIHDEVMPRMDELYTLELKLKSLQDSLSRDTIGNTTITLHQVNQRLSLIDKASKDMMDWMHSIEDVPDENQKVEHSHHGAKETNSQAPETPDAILQIQREQKVRIEMIKKKMLESIESTKAFLNSQGLH